MRSRVIVLLFVMATVVSCGSDSSAHDDESLLVTDGSREERYSVEDLKALAADQATFAGTTFVGVQLTTLLADAGYDLAIISAVKAVANDGFTANYGPDLVHKSDTIVAYARIDGALTGDDGAFRMVLPDQEGKLNPRHLVELEILR